MVQVCVDIGNDLDVFFVIMLALYSNIFAQSLQGYGSRLH